MNRRTALEGVGVALAGSIAGCISVSSGDPDDRSVDPSDHVNDWHDKRVRGEADPVETEETVDTYGTLTVPCEKAGRDAVQSAVLDRIGESGSPAFGYGKDGEDDETAIEVMRILTVGRDGEVGPTPDVSFATLRAVTPRSARATVTRDDEEHTCRNPVYVVDVMLYED